MGIAMAALIGCVPSGKTIAVCYSATPQESESMLAIVRSSLATDGFAEDSRTYERSLASFSAQDPTASGSCNKEKSSLYCLNLALVHDAPDVVGLVVSHVGGKNLPAPATAAFDRTRQVVESRIGPGRRIPCKYLAPVEEGK